MSDQPDLEAFLLHNAQRFERFAKEAIDVPKVADSWYAKAEGMHAVIRELRRLQRIEKRARDVDAIFDERKDVIKLRCKVPDGEIDHREHFLKLRKALELEEATEARKEG